MDGGRGKGKKGKAAKKKAAAAAQSSICLKKQQHIGKKVGTKQPNVQVVTVSQASATNSAHHPTAQGKAATEQTMTISKRRRLKKHTSQSLLKKLPETNKSPSPAVAKPHVVSLTGKEKKKLQPDEGVKVSLKKIKLKANEKKPPSVLKTKKTVVGLATAAASPKRKIAQVGSPGPKLVQTSGIEAPEETTTIYRKVVKNISMKTTGTVGKPANVNIVASGESTNIKEIQTPKKGSVVIKIPQSTSALMRIIEPRATQAPEEVQAKELSKKAFPVPHAHIGMKQLKDNADAPSVNIEDMTMPNSAKKTTAAVFSTSSPNDKPVLPTSKSLAPVEGTTVDTSAFEENDVSPGSDSTSVTLATSTNALASLDTDVLLNEPLQTSAADSREVLPSFVAKAKVLEHQSGFKRQRSSEAVSANSFSNLTESPAKRQAVSSKAAITISKPSSHVGASSQAWNLRRPPTAITIPVGNRTQPVGDSATVKDVQMQAKSAGVVVAKPEPLKPTPVSQGSVSTVPANRFTPGIQSSGRTVAESSPGIDSTQILASTAEVAQQTTLKATIQTESSPAPDKVQGVSAKSAAKPKMGIVMDSHAYVKKMMEDESTRNSDDTKLNTNRSHPPPRLQNAWGVSFGMVPPARSPSSPSRTLSTTPLSSWFLSNGCANFVKQVHFSDEDGGSSSGDDDAVPNGQSMEKVDLKRRVLIVKKNLFLESLTTQSNWRSWYGNVDIHNLLDPPLTHVPETLLSHEVTPLALPEMEIVSGGQGKKVDELEILEADIRREKKRGLAFSEQLLMMLQGKTVSGKVIEEEYPPLLNH